MTELIEHQLVHSLEEDIPAKKTSGRSWVSFLVKIFLIILVILVSTGILGYFLLLAPARKLATSIRTLQNTGMAVAPFIKAQDLAGTKDQLTKVDSDLAVVKSDFEKLSWTKALPWVGNYYKDGAHGLEAAKELLIAANLSIDAIAPYADVIGLKGLATTGDGAKTAQDRITFIINTLDKIKPQLTDIATHIDAARREADQIDPARYPEDFRGIAVRSQLTTGINVLNQAAVLLSDAKPLIESLPYMLGKDGQRKYLVIFQNDAELRPTGGFMTGYAIINVTNGKISVVQSDDIYKLDEKFPKRIPAPEPIKKYHPNVPYWYLRDQNLSPDFKVSMETFLPNYDLTKSPKVDGVIAMDTQVLVELLKVTGRIGVPGYGNFSADIDERCNCPSAFYELQILAGGEEPVVWDSVSGKIVQAPANYGVRKQFLGPVMYSILANVMAQPKAKFPQLFQAAINSVQGKHALMFFYDPKIQEAVESFNLAGRITEAEGDYLAVVDTNFSGAKTNIWVKYKADQKIEVSGDGTVTKTLTLTYDNPQEGSVKIDTGRKLNGLFRDWLRVYVPKGSELVETKGFESGQATSEDLGKTVFEGFFSLAPLNTKVITLKYKLPFKLSSPYSLLIQKQAGTKNFPYTTTINGRKQPEIILSADQNLKLSF